MKIGLESFLPIITTAIKNPIALALITPRSTIEKSPELPKTPATTVKIRSPKISSTTAAPIIVFASFDLRAPRSPNTLAVIHTEVAVIAAPTNRAISN